MSETVRSHRDLIVWQKAMVLVDKIYDVAQEFPQHELYGLRSQLTRAAVSVPANIAEGRARGSSKDFANFILIARSSLMELDTLIEIAARRLYIDSATHHSLQEGIDEGGKMLSSLRRSILTRGASA